MFRADEDADACSPEPQKLPAATVGDGQDADDSLSFAPATANQGVVTPEPHFPPPLPPSAEEPVRYSLFELLVLITVTAAMLASIRFLGAAAFAGIAGVLGFFMLVFISLAKPTRGIIHVAWWVILVIYLVAAVAAVLNKDL